MSTAPRPGLFLTASLLLAWAWLGRPPLATGQNFLGGEFQVSTYTTGRQHGSEVARNADGEFLVVWESDHLVRDAIFGQGFDATGSPLGNEFRVMPIASYQWEPSVAAGPDGNFIVVFNTPMGNVGQKYDASGTVLGASFQMGGLPSNVSLPFEGPDVASAADGSFVVVWEDYDYNKFGIRGRRFDSSGNPLTGEFRVNQEEFGTQLVPAVASSPNGDFVVVWWSFYRGGLRARRFDESASPLTGEFAVTSFISTPYFFDTAVRENGDFVVVWQDRFGANDPSILGRRWDASGSPLGGEFEVSPSGRVPVVASDADANFAVAWSQQGEVYAREYEFGGVPRTDPFRVNTTPSGGGPAIASDREGNFVVTWSGGGGILGQRFAGPGLYLSADGACPGPVTVSISNAPPNTEVAVVAAANTNGFVKGGALCNGTQFEIGEPFQLPPGFVIVDGEGAGEASLELGPDRCFLQALALANCETSNVAAVP
jgi:hypothetical protein